MRLRNPLRLVEQTAPATPPSGFVEVYAKADGRAYGKDDTGFEFLLSAGSVKVGTSAAAQVTTFNHNMGTRDVAVWVRRTASPYDFIDPPVVADTTNSVQVDFGTTVSAGEYTIIVIANASIVSTPPVPLEQGYFDKGDVSGAVTLALADGNVQRIRLTGNVTSLTINGTNSGKACSLTLICVQDGTGSRTIAWGSSRKWAGGTAMVLSTAINAVDVVTMFTVDGGTTWYAAEVGKAFA